MLYFKKTHLILLIVAPACFGFTGYALIDWNDKSPMEPATVSGDSAASDSSPTFTNFVMLPEPPIAQADLVHKVAPRFQNLVTREKLEAAATIMDILPEGATRQLADFQSVWVSALQDNNTASATEHGDSETLNPAQLQLLVNTPYSSNIYIGASCKRSNHYNEDIMDYDLTYYLSVIPENQAEFATGQKGLSSYLREQTKEFTKNLTKDQLKAGKVAFTVSTNGTVESVRLVSSSGYEAVDEQLVEVISNLPARWKPATNAKGEPVNQELVFFFGNEGC